MRKEIRIQAKLETADFDRTVADMQKKLRDMYAPSNMRNQQMETQSRLKQAGFSVPEASERMASQNFRNSTREIDKFVRDQVQSQDRLVKMLERREQLMRKLRDAERDMQKGGEDQLRTREKLMRMEENNTRLREISRGKDQALNQAMDLRERNTPDGFGRLSNAYQRGGLGGATRAFGRMMKNPSFALSVGGGLLTAAGTAVEMADPVVRQEIAMNRMQDVRQGATATGMSDQARAIFGGKGASEALWNKERSKSLSEALREMNSTRSADAFRNAGNASLVTGGLATAGAGLGGAIPTGGASLLATIGGVATAGYGAYNMVSDERARSQMLGGLGMEKYKKNYEGMLAQEFTSNYQQRLEAMKQMDPMKRMSMENFDSERGGNLAMQRGLGLTNSAFYGQSGYLESAYQQGFTRDQAMGMSSELQGAGASTEMSKDPSRALAFQRNMNLTNAPQLLGKLSGTMGGAMTSDQALIKILAEGMRVGIDASTFAEETRKFAATTAEYVSRSGARTEEGAARIGASFANMIGDTTPRGITAAQSAYSMQQNISSEGTGARGAMQAAFLMNDKTLGQLTRDQRMSLVNMSEEQINAGGAEIEAMAKKAGVSVEELQTSAVKMKRQSVATRGSTDTKRDKLSSQLSGKTPDQIKAIKGSAEFRTGMGDYISALRAEDTDKFKGMGAQEMESFALGQIQGDSKAGLSERARTEEQRGVGFDRMEDTMDKAVARQQQAVLESFRSMASEIEESAKNAANQSTEMVKALANFTEALGSKGTEAITKYAETVIQMQQKMETASANPNSALYGPGNVAPGKGWMFNQSPSQTQTNAPTGGK